MLLAGLLLALLAVAALFLWRSFGDDIPGTSVAGDSVESGARPNVRLTNGAGRVRVEGAEGRRSVEYEATKYAVGGDPAAARRNASEVPVDISREGSAVVIETGGGGETGADYALRVPAGGSVEVESGAGDVEVSGVSGGVTVRAEAGDVTVRDAGGDVTVEVPQGDVEVDGIRTDTGRAELEVGVGDLSLRNVVVGSLEAAVETGDVTLSGRFSGVGRVAVGTGDITANLPPEDTRDLTLETRVGEVTREAPSGEDRSPKEGER